MRASSRLTQEGDTLRALESFLRVAVLGVVLVRRRSIVTADLVSRIEATCLPLARTLDDKDLASICDNAKPIRRNGVSSEVESHSHRWDSLPYRSNRHGERRN